MRILNAYYLPADGEQLLYESISPVNTFRFVFNQYFDAGFPLLDDLELLFQNAIPLWLYPDNRRPSRL